MARIVNKEEYELKRNEILDTAQRLVYTRGFEQMSIQDILDERQISKGAFYHYFDSKQALLEAMIERIASQIGVVLTPIVQDASLTAARKMELFFNVAAQWKTARKDYFLSLLQVWYADENALVRQKVLSATIRQAAPWLTEIIEQGNREGVFRCAYPDEVCEIFFSLFQNAGENLIQMVLHPECHAEALQRLERFINAYQDAFERILGAAPGSLQLFDINIMRAWFTP